MIFFFFFFQAEDGIRDVAVTGVQTCALPILLRRREADWKQVRDIALSWVATLPIGAVLAVMFYQLLRDRKSTRLNSSHGYISYAVFCLKKKKKTEKKIMYQYRDQNL